MLEPEAVTTIVRLGQSGWGAKRIARTLGIARNTVRRYLKAGGPVPYRRPQRDSVLGDHEAWLRERFLQHRGNCDVVRQVFGDAVAATAILDRLLHHSQVITIRGDSYRLRDKRRSGLLQKAAAPTPITSEV